MPVLASRKDPIFYELCTHYGFLRGAPHSILKNPSLARRGTDTESFMAFSIMRTAKLKTAGNVAGACAHIERTIDTPNADPARTPLNEWLIGGPKMFEAAQKTWEKLDRKPRKNAVHGIEVLMTASPEIFEKEKNNPEFLKEFKAKSIEWLKQQFESKGAKIVGANLQLDESTPHIQAIIIPVVRHERLGTGLTCTEYLDGRKKLQDLQDSFANTMNPLGLSRGIHGSRAEHQKIKTFYSALKNEDVPKFALPRTMTIKRRRPGILAGNEEVEVVSQDDIREMLGTRGRIIRNMAKMSFVHKRALDQIKRNNQKLTSGIEKVRAEARELANIARALPLDTILKKLGYKQNSATEWVGSDLRLSVNGQKIWDIDRKIGGGGAIDLAKHILQAGNKPCDYKAAVSALSTRFGLTHETSIDLKKSITEQHRPPEAEINSPSLQLNDVALWRENRQSTEPPQKPQKIRSNRGLSK